MKKIFILFLFCCAASVLCAAEAKPLLKVGLISDTHVTPRIESCRWVKEAWKVFKKHNCDLVVNLGDIADIPKYQAYRNYRKTVNELFADGSKKPLELYVYANHDRIGIKDIDKAFADVKKSLEVPNDPYDELILKGYPFLVFPQFLNYERYEKTIAAAIKKFPGKPVFVLDHCPPYNTVARSKTWGSDGRLNSMKKFPQAVHISGHVHGSLFNELHIWQGEFTAVNAGSASSATAMIMEVFKDKLLFRRYSLLDGKEYCTDKVWNVPLPFDPATAPYRPQYRKEKSARPAFPANAVIKMTTPALPYTYAELEFSAAAPEVFRYMISIEKKIAAKKWQKVTEKLVYSDFWRLPSQRPPTLKRYFSGGYFDESAEYRITVEPINFYGKKGKVLQTIWKAPAKRVTKVLFESRDPMKELSFMSELEGGVPMKKEGDFYIHDVFNARLLLPDHVWKNIPPNTHLRFTVDLHTIQKSDLFRQWTLVLRNPVPLTNACKRITTFSDESVNRYVIDFPMQKENYKYYLLIREGSEGKIRFNYVKLELISLPVAKENKK